MIAVLWDLDGTLIDTSDLHVRAFVEALKRLGYEVNDELVKKFRENLGKRFVDIVRSILPDLPEGDLERLKELRRAIVFSNLELVRPLPPANLLPKLRGIPMGLVTSSNRLFTTAVLDRFGWRRYFDVVVTGDDVERGKPDPEPILLAMEKLGVSKAYFIGDSEYDRICAERAGIEFVHAEEAERVLDLLASQNYILRDGDFSRE